MNVKEDVGPAYQLRRYAWSAKLPLSIVTDFEEFAVYDCRVRPHQGDSAAVADPLHALRRVHRAVGRNRVDLRKGIGLQGIVRPICSRLESEEGHDRGGRSLPRRDRALAARALRKSITKSNTTPSLSPRELERSRPGHYRRSSSSGSVRTEGWRGTGLAAIRTAEGSELRTEALLKLFVSELTPDTTLACSTSGCREGPFGGSPPTRMPRSDGSTTESLRDIVGSLYYPQSPYEFPGQPTSSDRVYEQFLGKADPDVDQARSRGEARGSEGGRRLLHAGLIVDDIVQGTPAPRSPRARTARGSA